MKKVYRSLFVAAVTLLAAGSVSAQGTPTISVIGFDATAPLSLSKAGTNSAVSIVFTGASAISVSANTVVNGSAYNGSILQINSGGTVTITRPETTNDVITNAALLCAALSTNTDVASTFSTFAAPAIFGSYLTAANVVNIDNLGNVAYRLTPLSADYGDDDLISDLYTAFEDGGMDESPENIKSIKFTVANNPLLLYGILVYTNETQIGTGVESSDADKMPVSSVYYNLTGRIVPETAKGFVIRKTLYSDGSCTGTKIYNQ